MATTQGATMDYSPADYDRMARTLEIELDRLERIYASHQERPMYTKLPMSEHAFAGHLSALHDELDKIDALHYQHAWNRFYAVPGGKVHRSMHCSTCNHWLEVNGGRSRTSFVWLVDDSGRSVDEMIEEYGEAMCTTCYPSAPTNPAFKGVGKRGAAEEAAKQAARDERAAKRAAREAGIPRDENGEPLRVGIDAPKTLIAAQRALSMRLKDVRWYQVVGEKDGTGPHPDEPTWIAEAHKLAGAIERMTGESDVFETAKAKAFKNAEREFAKAVANAR